jgi:hypothetical protein
MDSLQVLVSPRSFFSEQEGRSGVKAPLALLLAYAVIGVLSMVAANWLVFRAQFRGPIAIGPTGLLALMQVLPFLILGLVLGPVLWWVLSTVIMVVWAGLVHLVCKLFGGQADYAGTFRAATYAAAPVAILFLAAILIPAAIPSLVPRMSPGFGGVGIGMAGPLLSGLFLAVPVYYLVLLGIGVFQIHRFTVGAAVGVAVVSGVMALVGRLMSSAIMAAAFHGPIGR